MAHRKTDDPILTPAQSEMFLFADPATELARLCGGPVAGLDEVGRGPLAGPVVASAVVLNPDDVIEGLDDSKKLSPRARDALFDDIMARALAVGIGVLEAERIDELNILRASLTAMAEAFAACEAALGRPLRGAAVDGDHPAPLSRRVRQVCIIGGDALCEPIKAASIIAKVTRDRRMVLESERYPAYGFAQHKGYPTAAHRQALIDVGPCPLHRRSFQPVKDAYARVAGADS